MDIEIVEDTTQTLEAYGRVSIVFEVASRLRVEPVHHGLGGFVFTEEPVEPPYIKDYDSVKREGPSGWGERWDIAHWGVLAAFAGRRRVGGAVVAYDTDGVWMLEGRDDLAVLWDVRVDPDYRRRGVGAELFQRAVAWARGRELRELKVETQNINVPACRFYVKQGCTLDAVRCHAYAAFPDEVELTWRRSIAAAE